MHEKSTIRKLLYNKISEDIKISKNYKKIRDKLINNESEILKNIKDDKMLEKLFEINFDLNSDLVCEETALYFEEGFRIGVILGLELLNFFNEQ